MPRKRFWHCFRRTMKKVNDDNLELEETNMLKCEHLYKKYSHVAAAADRSAWSKRKREIYFDEDDRGSCKTG